MADSILKVTDVHSCVLLFCPKNANLRSSRDAPHSSSMSDVAISPLSPICPQSSTDDVFWDSRTPPKVTNECPISCRVTLLSLFRETRQTLE